MQKVEKKQKTKTLVFKLFQKLSEFCKKEPLHEGSSSYLKKDCNFMWLFVGLGNPGGEYAKNRHNVGFMVIDNIHDNETTFSNFRSKFQGELSEGRLSGQKVILLKPTTYMNNSGQSVAQVAKFYKIPPENIIVFHDELDISAGDVRVKQGGGNAGHNGLKSIQAHLGTADFWRVRIGIGRPHPNADVSNYVLDNFSKEECVWLEPLIDILSGKTSEIIENNPKTYGDVIKSRISNN